MNKNIFDIKAKEYGISSLPEDPVVTMAYIPYQLEKNLEVYSAEQGICSGTMFPELNKPFKPCSCGGNKNETR